MRERLLFRVLSALVDGCVVYDECLRILHSSVDHLIQAAPRRASVLDAAIRRAAAEAVPVEEFLGGQVAHRVSVRTPSADYHIRAIRVRRDAGPRALILVSLDRESSQSAMDDRAGAYLGLTAREAEVATLLAQRRTNREIAEALGISERTARQHTERVLRKVGVDRRTDVAGALQRRRPTRHG